MPATGISPKLEAQRTSGNIVIPLQGRYGCQHFEASQLLYCERRIDIAGYLVLWQVGGNRSVGHFDTAPAYRALLVEWLEQEYPPDHEVIVYRGVTLPIERTGIRHMTLRELVEASMTAEETVVLPPTEPLKPNPVFKERLDALNKAGVRDKRQTDSIA